MPYDENGDYYDEDDRQLSPWEQAHGGEPYDPNQDYEENDFDRATQEYYGTGGGSPVDRQPETNWYQPDTYDYLINQPGPTGGGTPTPTPTSTSRQTNQPQPNIGPLLQPFGGQFQRPTFGAAARQFLDLLGPAPTFTPSPVPEITPFTATTAQDVFGDPSYGFRKDVGEKALLNNRAAQGLARSGGTLKDLLDYNQNFASQEFGNVDARRYRDWTGNRDTTFGRYDRGFESERAQFEPQLYAWGKKGDVGIRAEEGAYNNAFKEFQTDYDMWRNQQNDVFDRLKWQSEFGLDSATR